MLSPVLIKLALALRGVISAPVALARKAIGAGVLAAVEAVQPVAALLPARQNAAAVEGGVVAAEVLGPAAGLPVAVPAGPDGQAPAQGGTREEVVRHGGALPVAPGSMLAKGQEVVAAVLGRGVVGGVVEAAPLPGPKGLPTAALAIAGVAGVPSGRPRATVVVTEVAHRSSLYGVGGPRNRKRSSGRWTSAGRSARASACWTAGASGSGPTKCRAKRAWLAWRTSACASR